MNKQELKGKTNQVVGKVKEKAGELVDSPDLERDGEAQNIKGTAQEAVGTVRRTAGEAVDKADRKTAGK